MNATLRLGKLRKGCCNLLQLNKHGVQEWLKTFDDIVYAANGVLWHHDEPLRGVANTFNALRALGKDSFICSNSSDKSRKDLCKKAQQMGYLINAHEVLNSAYAVAKYLRELNFNKKVFLVGPQGIADELQAVGIEHVSLVQKPPLSSLSMHDYVKLMKLDEHVGAVVVGEVEHFDMATLNQVANYLSDSKMLLLATNRVVAYPVGKQRLLPGADVILSSIRAVSNRAPINCGKPNLYMCLDLLRQGVIKSNRTLLVGHSISTDIQFGYNCGFQTLLVGTGESSLQDVHKAQNSDLPYIYQQIPDLYLPKLSDLLTFLPSRNC